MRGKGHPGAGADGGQHDRAGQAREQTLAQGVVGDGRGRSGLRRRREGEGFVVQDGGDRGFEFGVKHGGRLERGE